MDSKKFQLRTTNGNVLLGYRARRNGKYCIAIMKETGQGSTKEWICLGFIYPEQLLEMVSSGPYLNLDREEFNIC